MKKSRKVSEIKKFCKDVEICERERERRQGDPGTPPLKSGAVLRRMLSLSFTTCMLPQHGWQYKNQADETEITQKN